MRTANQNADNVSDEEECEGKDVETLCEELAHFTPQLCDNDVAKEKCTEQCGDGKTPPGIKLIYSEVAISLTHFRPIYHPIPSKKDFLTFSGGIEIENWREVGLQDSFVELLFNALQIQSMNWFLYDKDLRHERVKDNELQKTQKPEKTVNLRTFTK